MEKISETSYSKDFRVLINGEERSVYNTPVGDFTLASSKGRVEFEIEVAFEFDRVCVRPIKHELVPQREGQKLKFRYEMPIDRPLHLSIEFDDNLERPLFLLVSPSESGVPEPGDGFHFFGPGLHDIGVLELKSHNTVYLAEGAVVRSALHADSAENSRICGRGILDAENFHHGEVSGHVHMIFLKNCSYVEVEGITVMNNKGWTVLQSGCRNNTICDVKVITW